MPQGVAGPTEDAVELVSVGEVIPGTSVRIVDPDGRPALTGTVGGIEIRGQSVSSGYWNDSIGSAAQRNGDWTRTGDIGFVRDNCLLIAGREKDTLLVNGITFHAAMLEQKLIQLPLLGDVLVVVIGVVIAQTGQEGVVCFLQKPKLDGAREQALVKAVSEKLSRFLNFPVHRVLVLPRNQIPLTTSGKVRRHKLRQAFERGDFERGDFEPAELMSGREVKVTEQSGRPGREDVTRNVLDCWADVLGLAPDMIELDRDFFDAGGDSLKAIELHSCLEDQWGQLLDQHVLFDCRTVREQVEFLTGVAVRKPCVENEQTLTAQPVHADVKGVAIVAMAGRFPDAPDLDAFWDILKSGRTTFREPPADRWQTNTFFDADPTKPGKTVCRTGSFLDRIEDFDAAAVGLLPEEARQMDPQQRLFLEIVTDLLDQSHLSSKRVGVFAGAAENEYFSRQALDTTRINPMSAHTNLANMLVARVSQQMHFTGPAIGLDAACATSLIAVHYACQSILSGECDAAIAGGVQLNLSEVPQLMFSQAGVLSANGVCAPFSAASDGFVPGEGAGAILLKTVSQAQQDGDQILGIIRGSAVNNDGGAMSSMAPSRAGQENVIRDAQRAADVAAQDIDFVEGHGAGTRIGDLVEVRRTGGNLWRTSDRDGWDWGRSNRMSGICFTRRAFAG